MKRNRWPLFLGLATAGVLALCGCNTVKNTSNDLFGASKPVVVKIKVGDDEAEVPVPTTGGQQYKDAVAPLAYGHYADAIKALQALVARKPGDGKAHFALAVAQEANGDFAAAKSNYLEADRLNGGSADPACVAGVKRLEMRGK